MAETSVKELNSMANRVRLRALRMAFSACEKGTRAHFGGALSCTEILTVLFRNALRYDPSDPTNEDRDRFFVSKAHCVLTQYSVMSEVGIIADEELDSYMVDGNPLMGYPQDLSRGLEYSGGSLGMAFSFAAGTALSLKKDNKDNKVYVLTGDGECDEGLLWETAMFAANYQLDNMTLIVDRNFLQLDGNTEDVMKLGNLEDKFRSFGWEAATVDGHDVGALDQAFQKEHPGQPYAIIAETVKGKGVSFMENKKEWHQSMISKEQYEMAIKELTEGTADAYVQ